MPRSAERVGGSSLSWTRPSPAIGCTLKHLMLLDNGKPIDSFFSRPITIMVFVAPLDPWHTWLKMLPIDTWATKAICRQLLGVALNHPHCVRYGPEPPSHETTSRHCNPPLVPQNYTQGGAGFQINKDLPDTGNDCLMLGIPPNYKGYDAQLPYVMIVIIILLTFFSQKRITRSSTYTQP